MAYDPLTGRYSGLESIDPNDPNLLGNKLKGLLGEVFTSGVTPGFDPRTGRRFGQLPQEQGPDFSDVLQGASGPFGSIQEGLPPLPSAASPLQVPQLPQNRNAEQLGAVAPASMFADVRSGASGPGGFVEQGPPPIPSAPESYIRYQRPGGEWQEYPSGQEPSRGTMNAAVGDIESMGVEQRLPYMLAAAQEARARALASDPFAEERAKYGMLIDLETKKRGLDWEMRRQRGAEFDQDLQELTQDFTRARAALEADNTLPQEQKQAQLDRYLEAYETEAQRIKNRAELELGRNIY